MLDYSHGRTEAFEMLYERNKTAVFRYFLRQTNNRAIAEELAQDVWANIIKSAHSYKSSAKFTTYLFQIAHNRFIDYIRRQSIRPVDSGTLRNNNYNSEGDCDDKQIDIIDTYRPTPDIHLEQNRQTELLKQLIYNLPKEQCEVFLLKEEAGLSLNDIAYVTDCNNETVKSRLRYAYGKLRMGLGKRV